MKFLTLFLCCLSVSGMAWADIGGKLYTDHYYYPDRQGFVQDSFSVWLNGNYDLSEKWNAKIETRADIFGRSLEQTDRSSFAFQVREGYFGYTSASSELKVGQLIIPWGKSDGINPTDYFTAKEYTYLNPDDETKRIGALGAMFNFTPREGTSPITLTGVFQAAYPQTKMLIPDQSIPQGLRFQKYADRAQYFQPDTIEFGGKLSYLKSDFDLSISYFYGFNHTAQYVFDTLTSSVNPKHFRQQAVGGDISFNVKDWVVRGESAVFIPENGGAGSTLQGIVQPNHWDSVVGVERAFLEDFRFQVQGVMKYQMDYMDPRSITQATPQLTQIQQTAARSNALIHNFQRQTNLGSTIRVSYASEESGLSADIFFVGYFVDGQDYLTRAQVGYKALEGLKLLVGMDIYGGDTQRPLGALNKNSDSFFEAKYVF